MKSPFPRSIYLEPSENLRIKLTQRQFLFKDVSKVTFNEPSCCKRFGEPASLNLVMFLNIHETFALYQRAQCFIFFFNI